MATLGELWNDLVTWFGCSAPDAVEPDQEPEELPLTQDEIIDMRAAALRVDMKAPDLEEPRRENAKRFAENMRLGIGGRDECVTLALQMARTLDPEVGQEVAAILEAAPKKRTPAAAQRALAEGRLPALKPTLNEMRDELKRLLASRYAGAFEAFCIVEYSPENVDFQRACKRLAEKVREAAAAADDRARDQVQTLARSVYDEFVKQDAQHGASKINLPYALQEDIAAALTNLMNAADPETLNAAMAALDQPMAAAEVETFNLMCSDTFRRFRVTPVYLALYPKIPGNVPQVQ